MSTIQNAQGHKCNSCNSCYTHTHTRNQSCLWIFSPPHEVSYRNCDSKRPKGLYVISGCDPLRSCKQKCTFDQLWPLKKKLTFTPTQVVCCEWGRCVRTSSAQPGNVIQLLAPQWCYHVPCISVLMDLGILIVDLCSFKRHCTKSVHFCGSYTSNYTVAAPHW